MSDTRHDPVRGSGAEPVAGPLGHLVVVFDNHIARSLTAIAAATGWEVTVLDEAPEPRPRVGSGTSTPWSSATTTATAPSTPCGARSARGSATSR